MTDRNSLDESWNKYWEHGFLTSCRNAFSCNYDGSIRARWEGLFASLDPGHRVLDICTGNGAIAMIANEVSRNNHLELEIHGIDAAAIRPHQTVTEGRELLEGIRFKGRTPAEDTGFDDGYFHAIVGQYALEYTDEQACVREMARISAPGARLQFIIHHDRSIVMETSREELRNAAILFEETRIFEHAARLIEQAGAATTAAEREALRRDPVAEAAREALNSAAAVVSEALQASPHPQLLQMALDNVAQAYRLLGPDGKDAALSHLAESRQRIDANVDRLKDLMAAGRTESQIDAIRSYFDDEGFITRAADVIHHEGGPLMGWLISATRP